MKQHPEKPIVIAAGGTGGHLFPAKSLAAELKNRHYSVSFVSDKRAVSFEKSAQENWHIIDAAGVVGTGALTRIRNLWRVYRGYRQALRLLKNLKPQVVVGFGGYASFPTVRAAQILAIPTIIHEQNAVFGRANRHLLKKSTLICLGMAKVQGLPKSYLNKMVFCGNPVREAIKAVASNPYKKAGIGQKFHLLILGGSQGSRSFSRLIPQAVSKLPAFLRQDLMITQQCRPEDIQHVTNFYQELGIQAVIASFFDHVPSLLAECQLLVSRAGASTIAELCLIGRPAVLIPLPSAADNHQSANCHMLVEHNAGWMLTEEEISQDATILTKLIEKLMQNPTELAEKAVRARSLAVDQAVIKLTDAVISLTLLKDVPE